MKKIGRKSTGYDFVSVRMGGAFVVPGIGRTKGVDVYSISSKEINYVSLDAQSELGINDVIGESILNGIEGKTYQIVTSADFNYIFSKNVIYDKNGLNKTAETEKEN